MDGTRDLISRAKAGDPVAYEGLIGRVSIRLLLHIRRLGGQRLGADFDAEDVLQTVLARASRSGYLIDEAEILYWGKCPRCRAKAARPTRT